MEYPTIIETTKKYIYDYLIPIIQEVDEPLEGNLFFQHETTNLCTDFLQKQYNILEIISSFTNPDSEFPSSIRIFEIGFNAGFSALLCLFANPHVHITCFDIGFHRYTYACYEKIRETFGDRICFFLGDSTCVLPKIISRKNTFDIFHLDSSHSLEHLESDLFHICRWMKEDSILIMNDTNDPIVKSTFEKYVKWMDLQPILDEKTVYHLIRKRKTVPMPNLDSSCMSNLDSFCMSNLDSSCMSNLDSSCMSNLDSWPKKIFQLWHSSTDVTDQMILRTEVLKTQHPDFEYELFFLDSAREFIRENFETKVLTAFDSIIPFAFKSDLWRYCILYKYGGIYLDMKYECTNEFRFSHLNPTQEYYVFDVNKFSIYNGFIVAKPNNPIFLHTINQIVKYTRERYYGENDLVVTGPGLLGQMVPEEKKREIRLQHQCLNYNKYILQDDIPILKVYHRYYEERKKLQSRTYYDYWVCREMYQ
jgi:predicted O-methyltransferase YrrM